MSRKTRQKAKKEMKKFWMFSFLTVSALLAGLVLQFNGNVHRNSLLSDSKKQVLALSAENDNFEARLSQSNSLDDFNRYMAAEGANYEKVDVAGVRYVHAASGQFAKK